jgi:hypothetical protein
VNAAAYAARRDAKDAAHPGPYQRFKAAAIAAQAAGGAGAQCHVERDAAIQLMLREWEIASYATVIHDFDDIIAMLSTSPADGGAADYAAALHAYGEAIGLVAGFKTIAPEKRRITDAQIDSLLQKVFAPDNAPIEAYRLKTSSVGAATSLQQAIGDIKGIYAMTDSDVEAFKKDN